MSSGDAGPSSRFGAERRAAAESALVHARPELAAFAVTGADRLSWLNGLLTQDVGKLVPGAGAFALAVSKVGRILAEAWVIAGADVAYVGAAADRLPMLRDHFERHLVMEDAEISEVLPRGFVFVHGPRALELVDLARARGADAAMINWTGHRNGGVVLAPEGRLEEISDALAARGVRGGDEAWDEVRVCWGVPRFGVDYDEETLPQEASLERLAVSFTKGCYLGQETVFRLEKRGHPRRRLAHLVVEGSEPVAAGAEIASAEGAVGAITSAAREGEGFCAIGSVRYKLAVAGTSLTVAGRAARVLGPAGEKVAKPAP